VGFFVNTLVLRTDTSANPTFRQLLHRVRDTDLTAYTHADIPFERLVEALNPTRTLARHPLFQTALVLQNGAVASAECPGLTMAGEVIDLDVAKFDLTVDVAETHDRDGSPAGLTGAVKYAVDLFDRGTVERLSARWLRLLEAVVADPDTPIGHIDLLDPTEKQHLLQSWGHTDTPTPAGQTLHQVFEAQAITNPDATAIICDDRAVSYAELNTSANRLAHQLTERGVRIGDTVGIHLERNIGLVTAVLATVKAGATWTMLDPHFPTARLATITAQSNTRLVISHSSLHPQVDTCVPVLHLDLDAEAIANRPSGNPDLPVSPDDLACVMYTSGSTGAPKGILAPHRAITLTLTNQHFADLTAGHTWLQCSPVSWDAFLLELFAPLLNGAACVLQPGQTPDPHTIETLIRQHQADTVHVSASLLNYLLDEHPNALTGVRHLMTGGEAASLPHIQQALDRHPGMRITNGYSPAENMIFTLTHDITQTDIDQNRIPVGTTLHGKQVHLLDHNLQPVPAGVTAELYMTGPALAHGSHHQPALTADRFTASPYGTPGQRMYRTGDLARQLPDGTIELLGRADNQVKIRGFRVEPAEISNMLTRHEAVIQAAVTVRGDDAGGKQLVAYYVGETTPAELRRYADEHLPTHLVPAAFVRLDALPRTPNGKLDHAALPAPELAATTESRAPRTPQEEILCGLFAEILGLDQVGTDDNFFALGGHSLLAAKLASRIRTTLDAELGIRELFQAPTVAGLAGRLTQASARPALLPADRPEVLPLSFAQARLWFLDQLEEQGSTYNVQFALRLTGTLDQTALEQALADLAGRHETLRTVFPVVDDVPRQRILDAGDARPGLDVRAVPEAELAAAIRTAADRAFDLATELPLRVSLFTTGPDEHLLLVVLHHIAADGWSMGPLLTDLATAYTARLDGHAPQWAPLPVQYADYTLWQHQLLGDDNDPDSTISRQLGYWTHALADLPDQLELPTDRPRPAAASYRGASIPIELDARLHAGLLELARANQVTPFMVLQAALATLLTRLGAGTDIPIGAPVAGRNDQALDHLVGFFVNTLV
ncbi:MAG TPA: amino acid adenylation domain-containing protein, partial [Micromonospora sp.]